MFIILTIVLAILYGIEQNITYFHYESAGNVELFDSNVSYSRSYRRQREFVCNSLLYQSR